MGCLCFGSSARKDGQSRPERNAPKHTAQPRDADISPGPSSAKHNPLPATSANVPTTNSTSHTNPTPQTQPNHTTSKASQQEYAAPRVATEDSCFDLPKGGDDVKQPGGRKYRVSNNDSRISSTSSEGRVRGGQMAGAQLTHLADTDVDQLESKRTDNNAEISSQEVCVDFNLAGKRDKVEDSSENIASRATNLLKEALARDDEEAEEEEVPEPGEGPMQELEYRQEETERHETVPVEDEAEEEKEEEDKAVGQDEAPMEVPVDSASEALLHSLKESDRKSSVSSQQPVLDSNHSHLSKDMQEMDQVHQDESVLSNDSRKECPVTDISNSIDVKMDEGTDEEEIFGSTMKSHNTELEEVEEEEERAEFQEEEQFVLESSSAIEQDPESHFEPEEAQTPEGGSDSDMKPEASFEVKEKTLPGTAPERQFKVFTKPPINTDKQRSRVAKPQGGWGNTTGKTKEKKQEEASIPAVISSDDFIAQMIREQEEMAKKEERLAKKKEKTQKDKLAKRAHYDKPWLTSASRPGSPSAAKSAKKPHFTEGEGPRPKKQPVPRTSKLPPPPKPAYKKTPPSVNSANKPGWLGSARTVTKISNPVQPRTHSTPERYDMKARPWRESPKRPSNASIMQNVRTQDNTKPPTPPRHLANRLVRHTEVMPVRHAEGIEAERARKAMAAEKKRREESSVIRQAQEMAEKRAACAARRQHYATTSEQAKYRRSSPLNSARASRNHSRSHSRQQSLASSDLLDPHNAHATLDPVDIARMLSGIPPASLESSPKRGGSIVSATASYSASPLNSHLPPSPPLFQRPATMAEAMPAPRQGPMQATSEVLQFYNQVRVASPPYLVEPQQAESSEVLQPNANGDQVEGSVIEHEANGDHLPETSVIEHDDLHEGTGLDFDDFHSQSTARRRNSLVESIAEEEEEEDDHESESDSVWGRPPITGEEVRTIEKPEIQVAVTELTSPSSVEPSPTQKKIGVQIIDTSDSDLDEMTNTSRKSNTFVETSPNSNQRNYVHWKENGLFQDQGTPVDSPGVKNLRWCTSAPIIRHEGIGGSKLGAEITFNERVNPFFDMQK